MSRSLFERQAEQYARHRPRYPDDLFAFLAHHAPTDRLAWDCASGNGQAAAGLATRFERVVATDLSLGQLAHAFPAARVAYAVTTAESAALRARSADLVTVAQALHWFDTERFYDEVRRVVRPAGIIAVITYDVVALGPGVDPLIDRFDKVTLAPHWAPARRHVWERYVSLPFPFERLASPPFTVGVTWRPDDLFGYLRSWSAVQTCIERTGADPVTEIESKVLEAWGAPDAVRVARWELHLIAGRV